MLRGDPGFRGCDHALDLKGALLIRGLNDPVHDARQERVAEPQVGYRLSDADGL